MTAFTRLDHIRRHLKLMPPLRTPAADEGGKRVQKNLSILESDAERLAALAKRDGFSQAKLLSAALDAYVAANDPGARCPDPREASLSPAAPARRYR